MADYDGSTGHDIYTGTPDPDTISGNGGDDALSGVEGDDVIDGGDDDDVLQGGDGNDTLAGGAGTDAVYGEAGNDVLVLGQGELDPGGEIFDGGDDTDWLRHTGTSDIDLSSSTLTSIDALQSTGGAVIGLTRIQFQNLGYVDAAVRITDTGYITLNHMMLANGTIYLSDFGNMIDMTAGTALVPVTIHGGVSSDTVIGAGNAETFHGGGGDDVLEGAAGDDLLQGGVGRDAVYGQAGNDVLVLGEGELNSTETFDGGADTDTLRYTGTSDIDLSRTTIAGVERLESTNGGVFGLTVLQLSGLSYINASIRITHSGAFYLDGITLTNGVIYLSDQGNLADLRSAVTTIGLTVHGGTGNDTVLGHDGNGDTLFGGDGNDRLDGYSGTDLLYGGKGDDTYSLFASTGGADDQIFENAGEGTDTIQTTLSTYTLATNFENLQFVGSSNYTGYGNDADNVLTGALGRDTLTGGAGRDTLRGGDNNDTLIVGEGDYVTGEIYDGGAGTDELRYTGTSDIDLSGATITGVERLVSSGGGAVSLTRAQLQAFAYVDAAVRIVDSGYVTLAGIALQNGTIYLSDFANYIDLGSANALVPLTVRGGALNDTILGHNVLADTLYGGSGDDLIDGQGGDDLMYGGTGNDQYYVTGTGDQVFENAGEGVDLVATSLSNYTLGANLENLTLFGVTNANGTGNSADNVIRGSLGRNTLTGGAGRDEFYGDFGNDTLVVAEGDSLLGEIYDGGDGTDILRYAGTSEVDFSGSTIFAIERLEITTSATVSLTIAQLQSFASVTGAVRLTDPGTLSVSGLTLQGSLTLSDGGNIVDFTGSPTTAITVQGGDGVDSVTGTAASDTLHGGGGGDWLDGGGGSDVMAGGAGNDNYSVDSAGDQVYESDGEGSDTVYTSISSYTLSDNVEGLVTTGTGYFTGIGNDLNNNIVGGEFGNNIDGRGGNDIIYGGAGAGHAARGRWHRRSIRPCRQRRVPDRRRRRHDGRPLRRRRRCRPDHLSRRDRLRPVDRDDRQRREPLCRLGTTVGLTIAQLQGFQHRRCRGAPHRWRGGGSRRNRAGQGHPVSFGVRQHHRSEQRDEHPLGTSVYGGGAQDVITGTAADDDQLRLAAAGMTCSTA